MIFWGILRISRKLKIWIRWIILKIMEEFGFTFETDEAGIHGLLNPKIGPKSALQILCLADASLLCSAILEQDPDHLHKMSGIGKKTAANLVSFLAGKVDHLATKDFGAAAVSSAALSPAQIDAIDALITLGYDPKEARTYVMKEDKGGDTKTLVQAVLKHIPIP